MNYVEFAKKIKSKYPQYNNIDDRELAQKMVAKFPGQYDVTFDGTKPLWSPEGSGWESEIMNPRESLVVPESTSPGPVLKEAGPVPVGEARVKPESLFEGTAANTDKYLRQPIKSFLSSAENIGQELYNVIDPKTTFPYVGFNPVEGGLEGFGARYQALADRPTEELNWVEQIATDPVSYIPGANVSKLVPLAEKAPLVGKFLASNLSKFVDPTIQTAASAVTTPDMTGTDIGASEVLGVGGNLAASKFGKMLGGGLKSAAVNTLRQDIKLNPRETTKVKFKPDIEVLFKNKDIPWTGGLQGIVTAIDNKLSEVGKIRNEYLAKMQENAIGEASARGKFGRGAQISPSDLDKYSVDLDKVRDKAYADIDEQVKLRKVEPEELIALRKVVDKKIQDLKDLDIYKPFVQEAMDQADRATASKYFNKFAPVSKRQPLSPEAKLGRIDPNVTQAVARPNEMAPSPEAVARLEQMGKDNTIRQGIVNENLNTSKYLPLIDMSLKRTDWLNRGKVNKALLPKVDQTEVSAYNTLWGAATDQLAQHPEYVKASGVMRDYLPLEKAIADRSQAIGNRYSWPTGLTNIPLWAARTATQSNPALKLMYGGGDQLLLDNPSLRKYIVPMINVQKPDGKESK